MTITVLPVDSETFATLIAKAMAEPKGITLSVPRLLLLLRAAEEESEDERQPE